MNDATDRLLAAADLLDKRAGEATAGPWTVWGSANAHVCSTISHCNCGGGLAPHGHEPGCGLEPVAETTYDDARYIATMHPEVGKALAAWLRAEAGRVLNGPIVFGGSRALFTPSPEALALADLLLAAEAL